MGTIDINLGRYILAPFVVLTTDNIDISSAPSTIGSVTLSSGDRVFLAGQNTATQNGGYVFNGAGNAMTRCLDMASGSVLKSGTIFQVLLGVPRKQIEFRMYATSDEKSDITIGTTAFSVDIVNSGKISYGLITPSSTDSEAAATLCTYTNNVITTGDDNYTVKLPLYSAYQKLVVNNWRNKILKVYPSLAGQIGAGVNNPIYLYPYEIIVFYGVGNTGLGQEWIPHYPLRNITSQVYQSTLSSNAPTGTTQTIDFNIGNVQLLDLSSATGDVTLTLSNPQITCYTLKIKQKASSPVNVVWPATVKWPGSTAPTISTGAAAIDTVSLLWDGTNYLAVFAQNYS